MRRRPRHGTGPDGLVSYTLEDLATWDGEDPKATIVVRRTDPTAVIVSGEVPPAHRGHGHGKRLGRQLIAALRAEGCRTVVVEAVVDGPARPMVADLGFRRDESGTWFLIL